MVQFFAGGVLIGTGTVNLSGAATLNYAGLAIGTYAITATYQGDANDAASISLPVSLTVGKIPTTTDLGSSTTSGPTADDSRGHSVWEPGPVPTGTVTFY